MLLRICPRSRADPSWQNASVCRAFRLGYAPPRQDEFLAAVAAQMQDLSSEDLQKGLFSLGIMRQGDSAKGGAYLMFRDRVMFPILRSDGCPIAFGGRILESLEGVPKYINSPESPIYHKRKTVYGISQASAALRVDRTALIVEGYTDVIALHQSGIENVVATCGTAVAQEHAQVLRRVADTAIVIFDGDSAGRSSAARCFERFINSGVELRVLFLAQGDDPDSLVRRIGSEAFMEMVQNDSRSGLSAFLDFSLESGKEDGTVLKAKVAKEVMGLISKVNNPVEQELLTQTVAEHIGVEFQSLNKLLSMVGPANRGSSSTTRRDMSHSSQAQSFDPGPPVFDDADIESYAAHAEFVSLDSESELASIRVGTNNSPRNTSRRSQVIKYLEQLLIAVVCDPRVAKGIAAIPSLLEKANIGEKKHESLQMLFAMVAEDEAPMGLQLSIQAGSVETVLEEWRVALASCGIQEGRILAEALRQSRVGGIRFEELVSAAQSVSEKSSMIEQLQTLRVAEAKAGDVADKLSLAQEKLKARRQMDKLSNVNNEK